MCQKPKQEKCCDVIRKMRQRLSTPISVYAIAIVLCIIFFVIASGRLLRGFFSEWWMEFFLNIGYSAIASVVLSVLIDYGNTKRKRIDEDKAFDKMNAGLKVLCDEMPVIVHTAVCEASGYRDTEKCSFSQWSQKLFLDETVDREDRKNEIVYVIQHITDIMKAAEEVRSDAKRLENNPKITEEYEKSINNLIHLCQRINRDARAMNYNSCFHLITEDFVRVVTTLFDELSENFTRAYDEGEYIE